MYFRILLIVLGAQIPLCYGQEKSEMALGVGWEMNRLTRANPNYIYADVQFVHKRSVFSVGYSFALNRARYRDEDPITPEFMKVPSLNVDYTFNFIHAPKGNKFSLGASVGYKFGHWRYVVGRTDYEYSAYLDSTILQVTHRVIEDRREADQHHFFLGLRAEWPVNTIRITASMGLGVVYQSSYAFRQETIYYNNAPKEVLYDYQGLVPFNYLSRSWYAKLGVAIPFQTIRQFVKLN